MTLKPDQQEQVRELLRDVPPAVIMHALGYEVRIGHLVVPADAPEDWWVELEVPVEDADNAIHHCIVVRL